MQTHEEYCKGDSDSVCFGAAARDENAPNDEDGKTPKALLPHEVHVEVTSAADKGGKARLICDHLSGMSDDFAVRTYRRLFDPLFGSLGDFI
jgi:dGTP triphosphohydrolase